MRYERTQKGPLWLLLIAVGAGLARSAWTFRFDPVLRVMLPAGAALFLLRALLFRSLTIRDEGD